ncbi:hypothetical protein YTPLAS18_33230 [Nitrospira sp.]|nr:hypothetical protein YTPLAS18_33230 [Nitrospira sp.]
MSIRRSRYLEVLGIVFAICFSGSGLGVLQSAHAEFYVAGQLGPQISNNLGNIRATGGPSGVGFSDLDLKNSLQFGVKAGYFLPQLRNFGFEVSASHAKPDILAQPAVVTGPAPAVGTFDRTSLRVITVTLDLVARAQIKSFEPYAGLGLGVFFARLKDPTGMTSSDNGAPGFHALAGYRSYLTEDRRVALVVEYNYQYARLSFDNVLDPALGLGTGLKADYQAHAVTFGLSYHFR